jgi:DNA-directed RNA polymerase specialized sigma24 family protein
MGDADFLARLRERAPDPATLVEVPRAQRFALRPALAVLFTNVLSKDDRDARCALAVREHGYTMKEIAEFLGLHYSTVSRALSRGAGEPAASGVLDFKT